MKIVSWNINGIKSCIKSGLATFIEDYQPGIICLQETKAINEEEIQWLNKYKDIYPYQVNGISKIKGYAGTYLLSKRKFISYQEGFGVEELDQEGRLQIVEYADFYLINVYLPSVNKYSSLRRQQYRIMWDDALINLLKNLLAKGSVILCGDLNAAREKKDISSVHSRYEELDIGFRREDDETLIDILNLGLIDTFRFINPADTNCYTWWSNGYQKREKNQGCRLDYILVSEELVDELKIAKIHKEITGSDHCPIEVDITI